jgi:hypothetical protein
MITIHAKTTCFLWIPKKKGGGVILLYYFKMFICWNNLVSTSSVLYFLLLDSSCCSNYCSSNLSKINLMGVILYIWQNKEGRGDCINSVVKNLESNNQYFFPQTMISRFIFISSSSLPLTLSDRDSLWFMCWQISEHLQPYVHDKPCDIQEQRFVVQFVLHPQLMSSINASYAGCWSIQSTDNIFFLYHPSMFFCWW